jgi:hypothetical protein
MLRLRRCWHGDTELLQHLARSDENAIARPIGSDATPHQNFAFIVQRNDDLTVLRDFNTAKASGCCECNSPFAASDNTSSGV